ncbi:MAG: ABC transporter substrate-binding protein [Pseudomonadota bacterium]
MSALRFCLLFLLLLPALAAAAEPIKIGLTGAFTGGSAPMGIAMREGALLALDEINGDGGVLGRPLVLVERDDQARPELGPRIAQDLIKREKVVAVVGFVNTGVALASQRYYQEARIPVMNAVATGSLITRQFLPPRYPDNYIFRVSASDTIQAEMIVHEAVDVRGLARLAIFADTTNYGQMGRDDLERALARRGLKPVLVERFQLRHNDFVARLQKARKAGAEAILTYGIGPELAEIANGMARLGWRVPLIGSWTLSMSNFIDNAGPNGEGATMPQTFIQQGDTPRRRAFIEAYQKKFRVVRMPSPPAVAQGYDAMVLLAAAIRQAGSTDGAQIRYALENLIEPVAGAITVYWRPFTTSNHEAIDAHIPVMGVVKNGTVVMAAPADNPAPAGNVVIP